MSVPSQQQDPAWYFEQNDTPQGPIPQAALPGFIAAGRISPDTLVWSAGMADWLPAREVPLFAAWLPRVVPQPPLQPPLAPQAMVPPAPPPDVAARPTMPVQQPSAAFSLGTLPPATGPAMPSPPIQPGLIRASATPGSDGLAIASLVLGCFACSLGLCLGIFGVPFGIAGLICGAKSATPGSIRTAGITTSIIGIVLTVVFGIIGIIMSLSANSGTFP